MKKQIKWYHDALYVLMVLLIIFISSCEKEVIEPEKRELVFPKHELELVKNKINNEG